MARYEMANSKVNVEIIAQIHILTRFYERD